MSAPKEGARCCGWGFVGGAKEKVSKGREGRTRAEGETVFYVCASLHTALQQDVFRYKIPPATVRLRELLNQTPGSGCGGHEARKAVLLCVCA